MQKNAATGAAGLDEAAGLRTARTLAAEGNYAASRESYVEILRADANCVPALVELGALAQADGYAQAALSAFSRATELNPDNAVAQTGIGNILIEREDHAGAKSRYLAALSTAPDFAPAHQGLARCLDALGEAGAEAHYHAGYSAHAVAPPRPSAGPRIALLLLAAARGGNVPCKNWIDPNLYSVTTLYADFFDETAPLPPHEIVVNAIGDAEICGEALRRASRLLAGSSAPLINPPDRVSRTSREENAARLRAIPGLVSPRIELLTRAELQAGRLRFPILVRTPGCHTGQNFLRVETEADLETAAAALPGESLLAIELLDARGTDGLARKYRAMFIDGQIYPLHLAASTGWKVHYFTSAMADHPYLRAEERAFLEDMPAVLGARAMAALAGINQALGLDYAGVDFALAPDGSLLLFEANATMIIHPPDERALWDYRRPAVQAAQDAAKSMLLQRTTRR